MTLIETCLALLIYTWCIGLTLFNVWGFWFILRDVLKYHRCMRATCLDYVIHGSCLVVVGVCALACSTILVIMTWLMVYS